MKRRTFFGRVGGAIAGMLAGKVRLPTPRPVLSLTSAQFVPAVTDPWSVCKSTPLADIRAFREQMRAYSVPIGGYSWSDGATAVNIYVGDPPVFVETIVRPESDSA